jgi:hypothetical protein
MEAEVGLDHPAANDSSTGIRSSAPPSPTWRSRPKKRTARSGRSATPSRTAAGPWSLSLRVPKRCSATLLWRSIPRTHATSL